MITIWCYSAFYSIPESTFFQQDNESSCIEKSDGSLSDFLIIG